MDLVDLVRIGLRRWYVAVPAAILVLVASLGVRSSVDLEYKSTGTLLLFAPKEAIVAQNRLLAFNSLNVPASVTAQVVSSLATREKLVAMGASADYEVGLDPTNPAPLVTAVATGGLEQAKRTVELVLAEVDEDLRRRQVALGAPPDTWITTEIVTPPTKPVAQGGARTRAVIAVLMVGMALAAGLTLAVDLVMDRRAGTPRRRRRTAPHPGIEPDALAPEAGVPSPPVAVAPAVPSPAAEPAVAPRSSLPPAPRSPAPSPPQPVTPPARGVAVTWPFPTPQPMSADRGGSGFPLQRRHPYLVVDESGEQQPADGGGPPTRKSGTD